MKANFKRILCIALIVFWMIIIYVFSGMNGNESHSKSKSFLKKIIKQNTISTSVDEPESPNENSKSNENGSKLLNELDNPIRKVAHAGEYCILAILIMILIFHIKKYKKFKYNIVGLIICFLYACTDEFHQNFVDGREAQFSDVLVDTLGAVIGITILWIIIKIINYIKVKKSNKIT